MAIDVRIPKEIKNYQEKVLFGLSFRQLISFATAIVSGVGMYFLFSALFGDYVASWFVMVSVLPILWLGFWKKNGFNAEQYLMIVLTHLWINPSHRTYQNELMVNKIKGDQRNVQIEKKSLYKKAKDFATKTITGRSSAEKEHAEYYTVTKKERKATRKRIKKQIKATRKIVKRLDKETA